MGDVLWPNGLKTKPYVTSAFGPRNINVPNASKNHKGVDMVGFITIRAIAAGQVRVAGVQAGWTALGNSVWVQHDGFFSKSGHSSRVLVRDGQFVRAGDPLCVMGRTGTASDVHLHLEITPGNIHYSNTGQVDPVAFISNRIAGTAAGGSTPGKSEEDDMFNDDDRNKLHAAYAALFGPANMNPPVEKTTWVKPFGEGTGEAYYGILDVVIGLHQQAAALLARPTTTVTAEQVRSIADAVVKAVGKPTVTLDYAAIAKAVNDDAARRMTS